MRLGARARGILARVARYGTTRTRSATCDQCREPATARITTTRAGTRSAPHGVLVVELACEVHSLARWRALERAHRRASFEYLRDPPTAPADLEALDQLDLFA